MTKVNGKNRQPKSETLNSETRELNSETRELSNEELEAASGGAYQAYVHITGRKQGNL